jgi:hypothetical protein
MMLSSLHAIKCNRVLQSIRRSLLPSFKNHSFVQRLRFIAANSPTLVCELHQEIIQQCGTDYIAVPGVMESLP